MFYEANETRNVRDLLQTLLGDIRERAAFYERKHSGYRIRRHDFESAFVEGFRRLILRRKTNEKYTFYETFMRSMRFRVIDVVRKVMEQRSKQMPQNVFYVSQAVRKTPTTKTE